MALYLILINLKIKSLQYLQFFLTLTYVLGSLNKKENIWSNCSIQFLRCIVVFSGLLTEYKPRNNFDLDLPITFWYL